MNNRRYPKRPITGVGAVILHSEKILLIQRGKQPQKGAWSLPGGAQKLGETIYEAARREIREETGLKVEILGLVDVVDSIRRDEMGEVEYHYTLVDMAAVSSGGIPQAGGDAQDCRWFTLSEIEAIEVWSETKRIISLAIKKFKAQALSKSRSRC